MNINITTTKDDYNSTGFVLLPFDSNGVMDVNEGIRRNVESEADAERLGDAYVANSGGSYIITKVIKKT